MLGALTCNRLAIARRESSAVPRPARDGNVPWAIPGAHSPRAGVIGPSTAIPVIPGHPARLWPSLPQLAGHVNIRRALLPVPAESP